MQSAHQHDLVPIGGIETDCREQWAKACLLPDLLCLHICRQQSLRAISSSLELL